MKYELIQKPETAEVTITERKGSRDGVTLFDVDVTFPEVTIPSLLRIRFEIPNTGIFSTYAGGNGFDNSIHQNWCNKMNASSMNGGSPLVSFISSNGRNIMTVAHSEVLRPSVMYYGNNEFTKNVDLHVDFFQYKPGPMKEYHATVYFDSADKRYDEAIRDAASFWENECGQKPCRIPEISRRPLYSCWYSLHQAADPAEIVKQCSLAREYGMETVILDDGWQCEDCNGGYRSVGDWEVCEKKIPDMASLVRDVHKTGMKFLLWYYFAGAGADSKVRKRFSDKLLNPTSEQCAELDVRYPEVREYLLDKYRRAILDWDLDGFKLDFVDAVCPREDTPPVNDRMDYPYVEAALDRLLTDICEMAKAIKPDFLIEFRQMYFGPAMRKFATMIRVGDCANDSYRNRVFGTNMRLSLGSTPVHSDMLMWNFDCPVEAAAIQVICTLFNVPQISVKLDEIPDEHKKMLKFYLAFYNEHNATLLDGHFEADNPEAMYSQLRSTLGDETVAVSYSKTVLEADGHVFFLNASDSEELVVKSGKPAKRAYTVRDCMGNEIEKGEVAVTATPSLHAFRVPRAGMVELF